MRKWASAALATVLAGSALLAVAHPIGFMRTSSGTGSVDVFVGSTPTPTPSSTITCDRTAANSSQLATAVTAASAGQTICLTAATSYGTWTGTNKSITIVAQSATGAPSPVAASMSLNLSSAQNFTLDGNWDTWTGTAGLSLGTIQTITAASSSKNFTIKNTDFGGNEIEIDNVTSAGIVLNHDYWHDVVSGPSQPDPMVWQPDGGSGLTVENSLFENMSADAINIGGASTLVANEFIDVYPHGFSGEHTDAIQFLSGDPSTIQGNWVHGNCEQGISGFDGNNSHTIEDNIVIGCTAWGMDWGGDTPGSTIDHNTVVSTTGGGQIGCSSKSGTGLSASRTFLRDNFAYDGGIDLDSGSGPACLPQQNTHNLNSLPTFQGGTTPSTWAGYALSCPSSAGCSGATDGGNVGARPELYPRVTGRV